VERKVGALSAPEAPGVDASAVFVQRQRAIIDVPASFGVEARVERIGNRAFLPAIIAMTREVIIVLASRLEVLAPGVLPAVHVDAVINVDTRRSALEGTICLTCNVIRLGMEWCPSVVARVQRVATIAGVC
jgi:hypothetical protein